MKTAIRCINCSRVVRVSDTYKIKVVESTTSTLTSFTTKKEYVGRICLPCAKDAGYKTRKHDQIRTKT